MAKPNCRQDSNVQVLVNLYVKVKNHCIAFIITVECATLNVCSFNASINEITHGVGLALTTIDSDVA